MYLVFQHHPTGFYIFVLILNMLAMLLWGRLFYEFFEVPEKYRYLTIFLFPLSFFFFTPFWNIFMYVSVQEKFVVWFSAISLYFFYQSYSRKRPSDIFFALGVAVLGVLSKPTMISLIGIYIFWSILDLLFYRKDKVLSLWYIGVNSILFFVYGVFTFKVQLKSGYTSSYGQNLNITSLIQRVCSGSLVVKVLLVMGIVFFFGFLVNSIRNKKRPFCVNIPRGFIGLYYFANPLGI